MNLPRLAKNSAWMVISRFGAQGLAVIFTVFVARRLGNAGFGEYAFVAALIFVANALTTFGTDMLLIREIAAKDDLSCIPSALLIQLLLSGFFIAAVWVVGGRLPNQSFEAIQALKIYSLALIPLAFYTVFTTILRGKQRLDLYTTLNLAVSFLQVGVVMVFIKPESTVVTLAILLLFVQAIMALLAGAMTFSVVPDFWKIWIFNSSDILSVLKAAAPIAVLALLGMLYQKLTITMLSTMRGPAETGIFSAAARAVEASKGIHMAAFAALYPAMAQGVSEKVTGENNFFFGYVLTKIEFTYFKILLAGALLASLILYIFASSIVNILYGADFLSSAHILQILAWTVVPFTVNGFLSLSLMASHKERIIGFVMAISVLILIILNLWWISSMGLVGAAWAFLVAECFQAGLLLALRSPNYINDVMQSKSIHRRDH